MASQATSIFGAITAVSASVMAPATIISRRFAYLHQPRAPCSYNILDAQLNRIPFVHSQVHSDILASIRAGIRKPQLKTTNSPAIAVTEASPAVPPSGSAASAATKEDEGLIVRRATRQRAKARIDAIFDVVAHTELMARTQLKKLAIPSELCDIIR